MLILFEYLLFIQMEPHNTDYNTLNVNKAYFVQIIKKFNAQYFKTMLLSFPFVRTPMILPFIIKRNNRCKQLFISICRCWAPRIPRTPPWFSPRWRKSSPKQAPGGYFYKITVTFRWLGPILSNVQASRITMHSNSLFKQKL